MRVQDFREGIQVTVYLSPLYGVWGSVLEVRSVVKVLNLKILDQITELPVFQFVRKASQNDTFVELLLNYDKESCKYNLMFTIQGSVCSLHRKQGAVKLLFFCFGYFRATSNIQLDLPVDGFCSIIIRVTYLI